MKDELIKAKINGLGQIAHVFGIPNKTGLLFVHGGPGNPNRHKIKDKLSPLFDKFLVCAYDQRGTGALITCSQTQATIPLRTMLKTSSLGEG